jgi:hypothetical protein
MGVSSRFQLGVDALKPLLRRQHVGRLRLASGSSVPLAGLMQRIIRGAKL